MTSDAELAAALLKWFERHANDSHRWRNPVGRVIKDGVAASSNWRNAPRGNPKAGFRAMVSKRESGS